MAAAATPPKTAPTLLRGDAAALLPTLPPRAAHLVVVDPPYGVTAEPWDTVPAGWWDAVWAGLDHACAADALVLVFGTEPFLSARRVEVPPAFRYRYDLVWDKQVPSGMAYAKSRPMQQTEHIAVFSRPGAVLKARYFPVRRPRLAPTKGYAASTSKSGGVAVVADSVARTYATKLPTTLLRCPKVKTAKTRPWLGLHSTQKPTALLCYLIDTYSRPGETVLDFTMGSGSTGVAALCRGRRFVGIEADPAIYAAAAARLAARDREVPHMTEVYARAFLSPV